MTKRMREIQAEILEKTKEAKELTTGESKDLEKAETIMNEVEALEKEFELEARIEKAGKAGVPEETFVQKEKVKGADVIIKMLKGQTLSEEEKALVSGTDATHGENYLVPDDVKAEINELRKTYVSAKSLVTIETTDALAGSVNYESGIPVGLTAFDDGDTIAEETAPAFVKKSFTISFFGKLIPISRILLGSEKAGLMGYLNRFFIKNAILTENAEIFGALKAGYNSGTPKDIVGWKELKKSITVDLDPSCLIDGVIVTNQSGFAALDAEEDADGRPVLQPNPANPTEKLFQGMRIHVFPDTQLPNIKTGSEPSVVTTYPMIYGSTMAGATFVEHNSLEFATSDQFGFNKNQNYMRVIEGFDVMSTDTSAYIYGSFSATPKTTDVTEDDKT